jgi:hypothetical protein
MVDPDEHAVGRTLPKRRIAVVGLVALVGIAAVVIVRWGRASSDDVVLYGNIDGTLQSTPSR